MGGWSAHTAQMADRPRADDLDEMAVAIIRRRRPDLLGKGLQEIKAALKASEVAASTAEGSPQKVSRRLNCCAARHPVWRK